MEGNRKSRPAASPPRSMCTMASTSAAVGVALGAEGAVGAGVISYSITGAMSSGPAGLNCRGMLQFSGATVAGNTVWGGAEGIVDVDPHADDERRVRGAEPARLGERNAELAEAARHAVIDGAQHQIVRPL